MNNSYLLSKYLLNCTENAALASYKLLGKMDEKAADLAAVTAMRGAFSNFPVRAKVVIGEGERDEAPMLFIGEELGTNTGTSIDIAVDPLEGTTILAQGRSGALSVIAASEQGGFLAAPDVYMEKIAIGFNFAEPLIDLDNSPKANLTNVAQAKKMKLEDLTVMILDRPRHKELIAKVTATGARIALINDGDIAAIISTTMENAGIDVYMGIGGAPEGVLAAAALKAKGGQIQGRLIFDNNERQILRAKEMGISDLNKKYNLSDLVSKESIFVATGVTDGFLLKGVKIIDEIVSTESVIMYSNNTRTEFIKSNFLEKIRKFN